MPLAIPQANQYCANLHIPISYRLCYTTAMKNLICLLFLSGWVEAANYITIDNGNSLYDVQLIVFARNLPQPLSEQHGNKAWVDTSQLNAMLPVDDDIPLVQPLPQQHSETKQPLQIPLQDQQPLKALAWFALENNPQLLQMVKKIDLQSNMKTLFFQTWRQPATPYHKPGYIKISNLPTEPLPTTDPAELKQPDFTVQGKIAFSKRRYSHGHVALNLLRYNNNEQPIIYRLLQKSQLKLDQWQYFDHRQFGVLMKVNKANFNQPQET